MSTTLSVIIPDEIASKLSEIAQETEKPTSYHIQKALETYLEEFADKQIAFDRLHNTSDEIISLNLLKSELEL